MQPFKLYATDSNDKAWQTSASLGNKSGDWSYWINVNHTDSDGQPLTFATRAKSAGAASTAGTAVMAAVLDANNANAPGASSALARSTTRFRIIRRRRLPTTSRQRCGRATPLGAGKTSPTATLFAENTRDSLYSQTILDPVANKNISRVQNIGRTETRGVEIAYSGTNVLVRNLDVNASVTYADSIIKENSDQTNLRADF